MKGKLKASKERLRRSDSSLTAPPILERDEPLAQQEDNIFIRDETAENLANELIDLEKQEEIQRLQYVHQLFIENPSNLLESRNALL